jgi:hypothetical protein
MHYRTLGRKGSFARPVPPRAMGGWTTPPIAPTRDGRRAARQRDRSARNQGRLTPSSNERTRAAGFPTGAQPRDDQASGPGERIFS